VLRAVALRAGGHGLGGRREEGVGKADRVRRAGDHLRGPRVQRAEDPRRRRRQPVAERQGAQDDCGRPLVAGWHVARRHRRRRVHRCRCLERVPRHHAQVRGEVAARDERDGEDMGRSCRSPRARRASNRLRADRDLRDQGRDGLQPERRRRSGQQASSPTRSIASRTRGTATSPSDSTTEPYARLTRAEPSADRTGGCSVRQNVSRLEVTRCAPRSFSQ
jgi:hypothetical protein